MPQNRILSELARERRRQPLPAKACEVCGAMFMPYMRRERVCSSSCEAVTRRVGSPGPKGCRGCGGTFTPARTNHQVYCTRKCMRRFYASQVAADPIRYEKKRVSMRAFSRTQKYRIGQKNYKARRRSAEQEGESISLADWNALVEKFGHACAYCRKSGAKLTMDHVVALNRGGRHVLSNIVPACQPCNSSKHDEDWSDRIAR